jgi:predicted aspartyl protease
MIALLLAALIQSAAPPPADAPQPMRVTRRSMPKPDSVEGDHADLDMASTAGLPTLSVTVNGKPLRLGFDTGASGGIHLSADAAARLALEPIGEGMAMDPSSRNPQPIKVYKLDALQIGSVTVHGMPASASPTQQTRREGLDGIIGLGAFDGYLVTVDYVHHHFRLDRGALPAADGASIFGYDAFIPEVPLTVEGRPVTAHLDTGNTRYPVIVPDSFATGLHHHDAAQAIGQAHTVSNDITMFAASVDGPVQVGKVTLSETKVGWPTVIDKANIGSLALANTVVTVDPSNKRVRLAVH